MNRADLIRFIEAREIEHKQLTIFWELFTYFFPKVVLKDETFLELQTKYSSKLAQVEISIRDHQNDLKRLSDIKKVCKVKRRFAIYMLSLTDYWIEGAISNQDISKLLNERIENPFERFQVINNDDDLSYKENDKFAMDFLLNQI